MLSKQFKKLWFYPRYAIPLVCVYTHPHTYTIYKYPDIYLYYIYIQCKYDNNLKKKALPDLLKGIYEKLQILYKYSLK